MRIPEELIEEIRLQNDIVEVISGVVKLDKKGNTYVGLCPFHNEKTPSFNVSPSKQLYHCFGCGASGNTISFIMQQEHKTYVEAIKTLAERVNITIPETGYTLESQRLHLKKETLINIHIEAAKFFYNNLNENIGKKALEYLLKRGVTTSTIKKFGLGYASSDKNSLYNHLKSLEYDDEVIVDSGLCIKKGMDFLDRFKDRLMFPIINDKKKIIAFGGRTLSDGIPKYLNSPETLIFSKSKNLYGLNFIDYNNALEVIIVEGYMDVISMYQGGIKRVCASLGTAFNDGHARTLKKHTNKALILYDADKAGINATLRAIPVLTKNGFTVRVFIMPEGKDPDDCIKEYGGEVFYKKLKKAKSHITFRINQIMKNYNLEDSIEKIECIKKISEVIAEIDNQMEQEVYLKEIEGFVDISKETLKQEVEKIDKNKPKTYLNDRKQLIAENNLHISSDKIPKAIKDAEEGLLNVIAVNNNAYLKLKDNVDIKFKHDIYDKIYNIVSDKKNKGEAIYLAEIINYFEDLKEQAVVSKVFSSKPDWDTIKDMEKAFNDYIITLKMSEIDERISLLMQKEQAEPNRENLVKLSQLYTERTNLGSLYIHLTDG